MENNILTSDFDYDLPSELIAQTPIKNRSESKLLVLNRFNGNIEHKHFYNIIDYLNKGDVLVLNDTKVLPARLIGSKEETKAVIELLLLKDLGNDIWECLSKPVKRLKIGIIIIFSNELKAKIVSIKEEGIVEAKLIYDGILMEILEKLGSMPLPPYITKSLKDNDRYQTVYAKELGSAAAPTAGLHFTKELLKSIEKKGVILTYVTLHIGLGTFRPVKEDNIINHKMHSEYYIMNYNTAKILNKAKANGKRIIAVGTTSTRVLETIASKNEKFIESSGNTDIFIYPGYEFKGIDCLITNFHLPKSTLLMLVSAFCSKEKIFSAYNEAINNKYRFFSFGDAMFINYKKNKALYWKNEAKRLNKNDLTLNEDCFKIYKGTNNIILSAPHAFKHIRNNNNKSNEFNTSLIVKLLKKYTNCHIIYTTKSIETDPNWDNDNYYQSLNKYINNNNIKYLIDIHGMKNNVYSVEFGTNNYKNINEELVNNIKEIFKENNINKIAIDNDYASSYKSLSKRIHENCNIEALQIEISSNYRRIKTQKNKFYNIINSLIDTINFIERK